MSIIEEAIEAAREASIVVVVCHDHAAARAICAEAAYAIGDCERTRDCHIRVGEREIRFVSVWSPAYWIMGCPTAKVIIGDVGYQKGVSAALEPYYEHQRQRPAYVAHAR